MVNFWNWHNFAIAVPLDLVSYQENVFHPLVKGWWMMQQKSDWDDDELGHYFIWATPTLKKIIYHGVIKYSVAKCSKIENTVSSSPTLFWDKSYFPMREFECQPKI